MKLDQVVLDRIQKDKQITNQQLAQLVGVTPETISAIRSKGTTSKITCLKLARALNVELSEILPKEER